jgi:enoyl-[acyl-carrier-protein] reductase (NADH)
VSSAARLPIQSCAIRRLVLRRGLAGFDGLLDEAAAQALAGGVVSIEDVGFATAFLAGDNARLIAGGTIHVDA